MEESGLTAIGSEAGMAEAAGAAIAPAATSAVVRLLKRGSDYYAPSAAICEMVASIVHDQKRVLPCAALLSGEYGLDGLFMGVPCRLGAAGLEEVVQIDLSAEERAQLERSAAAVRELIAVMGL